MRGGKMTSVAAFVIAVCAFNSSSRGIAARYSFDASLIKGGGKNVDLSLFEEGSQLPGVYPVDIILNGTRVDSRDMVFHTARSPDGKSFLKTCLTREMLARYGVKTEDYPELFHSSAREGSAVGDDEQVCADLTAIPQATEDYQFAGQRLLLSIPQVALRPPLRGIAPEDLWDDGMSAFLLNWQANAARSEYRGYGNSITESFWTSLEPGINLGAWRFRNMTTWNKSSGQDSKWESVYTRAERGLNGIKSRLTLGEDYTPSDVFDSVSFRGGMLGADESMVPYNQREFSPVVSGIARTQARVEVRQNGYLIQSQTVAPGAFALTDLPVTGSGGDLQVTVQESDGATQVFTVPFSTPAIALREGYMKYNVAIGEYRSSDKSVTHSKLSQMTVMYGLPWELTAFGGMQMAEHYQSGALGLGWSMGDFGAISVDGMHARSQRKNSDNEAGNSWRVRYNKSFELTGTSFTAASYQYSSAGYHALSDVLDTYRADYNRTYNSSESRSRRTTLSLSQSLGKLGYVGLSGSRSEYRNNRPKQDSFRASFSTTLKNASWSVSWSRNMNTGGYYSSGRGRTEDNVSLWVNIPLGRWWGNTDNDISASAQMVHTTARDTQYEAGLNGRAFERRLYWNLSEQMIPGRENGANTSRLNMTWYGTYGQLNGMYSYSSNMRQMSAGMSGGMVVHSEGITLGQKTSDTVALVAAPGVNGATVGGWPGIRTDFRGYTLATGVPYQENVVTLDPTTFPEDAEVPQTDSRVVPTKGAVVRAGFQTRVGGRALLTLTRSDGTPLPFGSVVTMVGSRGDNSSAGVVGDKGEVYMSGLPETGRLEALWGENSKCYADYRLPKEKGKAGIFLARSICM
ncbi:TPA: fimbria/pilus outer membrane usher protein [Escherichia coli]|nr:fimbria/pilus outer membrane usher protein [Escherichia coli]